MSQPSQPQFRREPIFWTTTLQDYNKPDRERHRMEKGRRVIEKVPQIGHVGDYENKQRAQGTRYVNVVRHEGHIIPLVLTNAASLMDPGTTYGTYMRNKARALGWFALGSCPVAELKMRQIPRGSIVDITLLDDMPCEPGTYGELRPCPHTVREILARRLQWNADQAEKLAAYKSEAEKLLEETRKQPAEMAERVAQILADALKAMQQLPTPPTPPPASPSEPEPTKPTKSK